MKSTGRGDADQLKVNLTKNDYFGRKLEEFIASTIVKSITPLGKDVKYTFSGSKIKFYVKCRECLSNFSLVFSF